MTLFELGREITSVLNVDELLQKIPTLIARITKFQAFAVYLLDPRQEELSIAYSVGYPDEVVWSLRVKVGEGLVGAAVAEGQPILVNDVHADPRYHEAVPGSNAELVVPLRRKGRVIGALNLLSDTVGQFTETDEALLRQFGAHVAVAIENARLFEHERQYTGTLETLSEIAREFGSILNLDELLMRIANLTRRVIDYRTFGILLVNDETGELDMKVAVRYGDKVTVPRVKLGHGLVGYAALHKETVLVPDVAADPRYIKLVDDARSELVIPLLLQDRCIGVFDLESPELDAFSKSHVEILTLLASQAAVAIENARLYETIRANEVRLEKEIRFAQRVQAALLPVALPKRMKHVDVAARFAPAHELGGDLYDFLAPEPNSLVVAVGDVSGKGRARRALQRVRRRADPLAHLPSPLRAGALQPGRRARVDEHDPPRAPARGVLLHAVLRAVRLQAADRDAGELRPAVPDPLQRRRGEPDRAAGRAARIVCGIHLRRAVVRPRAGRRVRLLLRRRVRGERRARPRVRLRAAARGGRQGPRQNGAGDRRRHLRRRPGLPRRDAAQRRHDRRRAQGDGMRPGAAVRAALEHVGAWWPASAGLRVRLPAPRCPEGKADTPNDFASALKGCATAALVVLCGRGAALQAGLFAQASPTASPTAAELKAKTERRVQDIAGRVDGVVGYAILDLTSGDRIGHLDRETFPTASAIKIAIVYELFKQAAEGKIRLDDTIRLERTKAVGGSGVLVEMGTPTLSICDYATLMVTLSDNTATNVLIDRLGMENITRRMQGLGLNATKLRRHMMDLVAARRGDENVSTPDDPRAAPQNHVRRG